MRHREVITNADERLKEFSPEARGMIQSHWKALETSACAFRPLLIRQLRAWEGLFPPERESLMGILRSLASLDDAQRDNIFRGMNAIPLPEKLTDLHPLFDEERLLDRCLRHFKKEGTYQAWRLAVDDIYQNLTALAEAPGPPHPKLVVVILGEGTTRKQTIEDPDRQWLSYFWNHLRPLGTLFTKAEPGPGQKFAGLLSGSHTTEHGASSLFTLFRDFLGSPQIKVWAIETGTELKPQANDPGSAPTWFSFEHLRPVMDRVTRKMAGEMLRGISGPEALYQKVTDFKMEELGLPSYEDLRIQNFIRQVIVQGSGALLINNSFAEWAALQALRRVEPDLLVVRFGARRRFVPLRQLDPFQNPKPSSEELPAEDPGDSLLDADVLAYYIWLETRKNSRFKDRTYFLMCFEGSEAALLLGPGVKPDATFAEPISLEDFVSTLAHLLGADSAKFPGRVLHQSLSSYRKTSPEGATQESPGPNSWEQVPRQGKP